jgi:tetratricopeptide (TPR) repeat protein
MRLLLCLSILTFAVYAQAQTAEIDLGIQLYREGKFAEATAQLESTATLSAKHKHAWLYLGAAYAHLERMEDARKAFRTPRTLKGKDPTTFSKELKITSKKYPQFDRSIKEPMPVILTLAVEFRSDGKIGLIVPFHNEGSAYVPAAVNSSKGYRFEPAEIDGKPVTTIRVVEYQYSVY